MSEQGRERVCPHGIGPETEYHHFAASMGNKGYECSCCKHLCWSWQLDDEGRCGRCRN